MEANKNKINGNKGVYRALITIPENETDAVKILNEFDAVAVPTENKQLRYSFENEEFFYQVLRTGEANINSERLISGLPLFDNHPEMEDAGVMFQLGITTDFQFTTEGLVVRCKLGSRADECLRSDIKNGIAKTVSIEGDIQEYSIERKPNEVPIYYADLWTPTSLSFAPVPQDIAAQIEVKRAITEQVKAQSTIKTNFINSLTKKFNNEKR